MVGAVTLWSAEHFIGGHPALDLANTIFDRHAPAEENELLNAAADLAGWFQAVGLADAGQARTITEHSTEEVLTTVRTLREAAYAIFAALSGGRDPEPGALGTVLAAAAEGLRTGAVGVRGGRPALPGSGVEPEAVPGFLALLALDAYFTLPPERLGACPRCGWLFVDTSRGGRRRWCSMKTCGNREKVARHRNQPPH